MHGHYYRTMCNERRTATIRYREEQSKGTVSNAHIGCATEEVQGRKCI